MLLVGIDPTATVKAAFASANLNTIIRFKKLAYLIVEQNRKK